MGCAGINNPGIPPGGEPPRFTITAVVDDEDRQPINGARVTVDQYVLPPTDNDGRTSAPIPMGWHTIRFSAPGYCGQIWTVNVLERAVYGVGLVKGECK